MSGELSTFRQLLISRPIQTQGVDAVFKPIVTRLAQRQL